VGKPSTSSSLTSCEHYSGISGGIWAYYLPHQHVVSAIIILVGEFADSLDAGSSMTLNLGHCLLGWIFCP
jgi:hypothetical protein